MSADVQHVLNQCYNFFSFLFLLATFKGVFKLTFHELKSSLNSTTAGTLPVPEVENVQQQSTFNVKLNLAAYLARGTKR